MNQRRLAVVIVLAVVLFLAVAAVVTGLVVGRVIESVAGGKGDVSFRTEEPASVEDLRDSYELGTGSLEVNLENIEFPEGTTEVAARVDAGALTVVVPKGVSVRVEARAENGALSVFDATVSGEDIERDHEDRGYAQANRRLSLDLSTDTGVITVQRKD